MLFDAITTRAATTASEFVGSSPARLRGKQAHTHTSLPITGKGVVSLIITDLCVFEVKPGGGLALIELHPGVALDEVKARTGAPFAVALR